MGLGLLGRGVGDAVFLAEQGAELTVTDFKPTTELAPSLEKLKRFPNINYTFGTHKLEDFRGRDLVLYGPKTPLDSPYLAEARKESKHVTMSTALFAKLASVPTVGVTGTRGKTTTTMLITHTLAKAGKRVLLGGNVRGVSTLALLPEVKPDSIAVLELDSWQLQGFRDEKLSPHIAVFTNFMQDHLDYYTSEAQYFEDKAAIFRFQKPGDTLIVGSQVTDRILDAHPPVDPIKPTFPGPWKLKLLGAHNKEKATLAAEALRALGLTEGQIKEGLESFEPVPGRLEFVREVRGVKIYNDNNATTPEATLAALDALGNAHTILIMGGSDKGLDMSALMARLSQLKKVVRIEQGLPAALSEAVSVAKPGDTILFSPAYASFGMFKNEYDRNDQFMAVVKAL